jgi:hypothetical protein
MSGNYSVKIEVFAEKYFIKSFQKKHKVHWDITLRAITAELERIDNLLQTDRAVTICDINGVKIIKTKFKVVGTQESAKTSGNRCIVAWNKDKQIVSILLVYGKTDLSGNNETAQWKSLIKENYPEYSKIL